MEWTIYGPYMSIVTMGVFRFTIGNISLKLSNSLSYLKLKSCYFQLCKYFGEDILQAHYLPELDIHISRTFPVY